MKRAFCRAEELIYLGLNMRGLHQGFPILWDGWAGGVGQAGVPSTLDTVHWGQPGAGRRCVVGLQVMSFS